MNATGEPTPIGAFGVVMATAMDLANTLILGNRNAIDRDHGIKCRLASVPSSLTRRLSQPTRTGGRSFVENYLAAGPDAIADRASDNFSR
jgi:hypothetical protein